MSKPSQASDKQPPKSSVNTQQGGRDRDDTPGQQQQSGAGSKGSQQGDASTGRADQGQQGGKSGSRSR